jgi:hypothetical protein
VGRREFFEWCGYIYILVPLPQKISKMDVDTLIDILFGRVLFVWIETEWRDHIILTQRWAQKSELFYGISPTGSHWYTISLTGPRRWNLFHLLPFSLSPIQSDKTPHPTVSPVGTKNGDPQARRPLFAPLPVSWWSPTGSVHFFHKRGGERRRVHSGRVRVL